LTATPAPTSTPTFIPTPAKLLTVDTIADMAPLYRFDGRAGFVMGLAFSPDGSSVAVAGDTLQMWNLNTGQLEHTFTRHKGFVTSLAFSPDGRQLVSGGHDNMVILWEVGTGKVLRTLSGHAAPVQSVAFSSAGDTLASGAADGALLLWDANTG